MTLKEVQDLVSAVGTLLAGVAAIAGIYIAHAVHKNQKLLAQRQQILPLWQYMAGLSEFNPAAPIALDAVKNVNTLELVALCCEGGMIDEKIIRRTFRDQFMARYEEIEQCALIPGLNKTGKKLLDENSAAVEFYTKLRTEKLSSDRLLKV